jgi:hypothetical protein
MLRLLLPVLLLLLGVGGGVAAGLFLGPDRTETDVQSDPPGASPEPEEDQATAPSERDTIPDGGTTEYVRLNNQFVVPIVRGGAVRSLVVMSLTLEVSAGQNGAVFDREPRLRDSFLQVLFAHANAGGFDGSFTEAFAMDPLREALNEAATAVLGAVVQDVLIVDITRQDA